MIYKNGKEILPAELLIELQQYVQGEIIYIPKKEPTRAGWGQFNGTRATIRMRNQEIYKLYTEGLPVGDLRDSCDGISQVLMIPRVVVFSMKIGSISQLFYNI